MRLFTKDNVIMGLLVAVSIFATLFYREREVSILIDKIERTESLLRNVKWNENSRNYLLRLGYNIPVPPKVKADTTEAKEAK